jgi:hypothetical protein
MDARPSTDPRDEPDSKLEVKPGSMLEVVAISIAWLCGLDLPRFGGEVRILIQGI